METELTEYLRYLLCLPLQLEENPRNMQKCQRFGQCMMKFRTWGYMSLMFFFFLLLLCGCAVLNLTNRISPLQFNTKTCLWNKRVHNVQLHLHSSELLTCVLWSNLQPRTALWISQQLWPKLNKHKAYLWTCAHGGISQSRIINSPR